MSVPPAQITIKRKRKFEPVDVLQIQEEFEGKSKRHLTGSPGFVFRREVVSAPKKADPSTAAISGQIPQVKASLPGDELNDAFLQSLGHVPMPKNVPSTDSQLGSHVIGNASEQWRPSWDNASNQTASNVTASTHIRRFHITRSNASHLNRSLGHGGMRKRAPVVFAERRAKAALTGRILDNPQTSKVEFQIIQNSNDSSEFQPAYLTPRKKPGINRHLTAIRSRTQLTNPGQLITPSVPQNVRLPSGTVMPWDNSERLALEMEAYALEHIESNKPSVSQAVPAVPLISSTEINSPARKVANPRFKPKLPAAKTKPEQLDGSSLDQSMVPEEVEDDESDVSMGDDADYIIDTYVRIPAASVSLNGTSQSIGLLILDSQPDMDDFYNEESDSEEDSYDEEDENAENHPSHDYPDEEVDSDDEFNRDPYNLYRKHNASDMEEYDDEDDDAYSDDDNYDPRHPWKNKNGF